MQSSSQYLLGGNIFLSELIFNKPWLVSELMYHESIHQKLYDFRRGHTVLKEDAALNPDSLAKSEVWVQSPWNYPDNRWDTHRVLAAFHVYLHVSLLSLRSEELSSDLGSYSRAEDRADTCSCGPGSSSLPSSVEGFSTIADRSKRVGRTKSASKPARMPSDARRLGDRFRERFTIRSWCLRRSDSATMERTPPGPSNRARVATNWMKRTARLRIEEW
jgi:hypothetical protein